MVTQGLRVHKDHWEYLVNREHQVIMVMMELTVPRVLKGQKVMPLPVLRENQETLELRETKDLWECLVM